jgi:prephenate dehydratase
LSQLPVTVAVQGEPGSNSALAAAQTFGEVDILPCHSFADLFKAVKSGKAPYGMAPVENSLGGSVFLVWDQLERNPLPIAGELYFHVRHCLIAHPNVRLEEIRHVYSHEQALAQCQRYLNKLVWIDPENITPAYDTAGAVKMIKARGKREEAAIASPQAAEIYNMAILAEDIQTDPRNHTRFLVLAHDACAAGDEPGKTTLILTLDECACILPCLLAHLTGRGIEICKIETRKKLSHPWEYWVYLECAGRAGEAPLSEALKEIEKQVVEVRIVGSYSRTAGPESKK